MNIELFEVDVYTICYIYFSTKMAKVRTRSNSTSHLSIFVGTGRKLLVSELPTVRDILRYGIYLREQSEEDKRNYPVEKLVKDIYNDLILQWKKANALFTQPVINSRVTIMSKLKEVWDEAVKISLGKGKLEVKKKFSDKLDKLFDILTCKCHIRTCEEVGCNGCEVQSHINCSCSKEKKIPIKDLSYIKGQKEKIGSKGPHQIAGPDIPEHKKQSRSLERKNIEENRDRKRRSKEEYNTIAEKVAKEKVMHFFADDVDAEQEEFNEEIHYSVNEGASSTKIKKNYDEIPNIALASVRDGVVL